MKKILIAEIGNNHFGSIKKAKELIRAAKESGATLVKSQAFLARDIRTGSMPWEFYRHCELDFKDYEHLIYYSREIGIEFFYSIFSKIMEPLCYHQRFHKIAGGQVKENFNSLNKKDVSNLFMSIPQNCILPIMNRAEIMFVGQYLDQKPDLSLITYYSNFYKRPVGFSDHSVGIENCVKAVKDFNSTVIEKHFHLGDKIIWNGQEFRDSIHSACPKELEQLAKEMEL